MFSVASVGHNGARGVVSARFLRGSRWLFTCSQECHSVPETRNTGPSFSYPSTHHHRFFSASAGHCNSSSPHQKTPSYSYIVVGAGSAGCVLANRLTEDAHESVLLLEAGPKDMLLNSLRLSWKIHMPAALTYNLCDDKYNWYYHTLPQAPWITG
ncbi:hypothetical protein INR49_024294 [Caranx melampygus]|nr:hypothetical protein INR49_024294 [Caranx melampygus]